ncbi:MAG: class I SAM-dependent methyltransferase [Methanocellales archaeon]|nr:class I SAM-dependent methyltransferase [Methanocellales archaeon]
MSKRKDVFWSENEYEKMKEMDIVGPIEFSQKRKSKQMIELMPPEEGGKIVEIGCGSGDLLRQGWIGLDIDRAPLAKIKNTCVQGDICHLPFVDEVFDRIIISYCLSDIENDTLAIREIYRILKRNGISLIEVPYNSGLYSVKDKIEGRFRRYDDGFIDLLTSVGFKILKKKLHGGG